VRTDIDAGRSRIEKIERVRETTGASDIHDIERADPAPTARRRPA
jgi:hypothetical protein